MEGRSVPSFRGVVVLGCLRECIISGKRKYLDIKIIDECESSWTLKTDIRLVTRH